MTLGLIPENSCLGKLSGHTQEPLCVSNFHTLRTSSQSQLTAPTSAFGCVLAIECLTLFPPVLSGPAKPERHSGDTDGEAASGPARHGHTLGGAV